MKICLLDLPVIILIGFFFSWIYAKRLVEKNPDWYIFGYSFFILIFWLNALLSYLGVIEPWFWGRFCVFIDIRIALFYLLAYPLWFSWGKERAYGFFGSTPQEGGLFWIFGFKERTKPFKPAWRP